MGFKAIGVEPNKWLVKYIKNKSKLNILAGTLTNIKNKGYNLICFWDVFEHVTDVNKTLKHCKKILNKDGQILINIPDYDSLARKVLGFKWPFFLNVHFTILIKIHFQNYSKSMVLNLKKYNTFSSSSNQVHSKESWCVF